MKWLDLLIKFAAGITKLDDENPLLTDIFSINVKNLIAMSLTY
jgi:hypothetical protein